jgi:hypothetical protein
VDGGSPSTCGGAMGFSSVVVFFTSSHFEVSPIGALCKLVFS